MYTFTFVKGAIGISHFFIHPKNEAKDLSESSLPVSFGIIGRAKSAYYGNKKCKRTLSREVHRMTAT
jgi:hypothetical protein